MRPSNDRASRIPIVLVLPLASALATSAAGQQTQRVSLPDGFWDFRTDGCDVSDDGVTVVYASVSSNTSRDRCRIERFDRSTATTTTVASAPTQRLSRPAISGDGATVAFVSERAFDPADTNLVRDVYVVTPASAAPLLVSAADGTASTAGNGESSAVRVSGDGGLVVFQSYASNLTADSL